MCIHVYIYIYIYTYVCVVLGAECGMLAWPRSTPKCLQKPPAADFVASVGRD